MKEYRIVATIETENGTGTKRHYESASPWVSACSVPHYTIYATKTDAKKHLSSVKQRSKEFCKKTHEEFEKDPRNSIKYTQTNIRIQSREVTKWTDE